jgi:diacylglycerol kinase (ATP)
MSRAGVLINPKSGRGNGKGVALAKQLSNTSTVTLRLLEDFSRLTPYLMEMSKEGVTDLFISSGDGTIQAVQTLIAEKKIFKVQPRICLLPHGTTNLTAADIGFKRSTITDQAKYICALQHHDLRVRHTLRILNPGDGATRHGMTLGVGAAAEATHYAQNAFNDKGVKGNLATFATIGGGVVKSFFSKGKPDDPTRFDKPYDISIRLDGNAICEGPQLMFFATTLKKVFFNAMPFWGGKSDFIRGSVFPYPVPNLVRWLLPIMYGSETRKMPKGAISFSAERFEIKTPHRFVLDGEFFDAPKTGPLKIELGPAFTYICG